ncbi:unnamed protein product [Oncorhynchus mykiss]|uniref:Uncharacterized protein n=1 Tax=Oncorhynchus mykiss TaxID=8022 RepID=A0A060YCW0_ONCMY|nr:unnamed protein product [Oncorhynchus mykiss]
MFRIASDNNIDVYADSVSETCVEDVVPIATIKTFPNQKPWIDGSIRVKLKARTTAFNQGKVTGNMTEYKQCSYSLRKSIKQAKRQYRDKVESQFNGSDTRGMWQGLQSITDYKKKTSPVTDQDALLPGRLNNFFARFEDNTVPLTRPATKTCKLSFTAAEVHRRCNLNHTAHCPNPSGQEEYLCENDDPQHWGPTRGPTLSCTPCSPTTAWPRTPPTQSSSLRTTQQW